MNKLLITSGIALLVICAISVLVGCAAVGEAIDASLPASAGSVDQMNGDLLDKIAAADAAAAEGNWPEAVGSGLGALMIGVGLSRRRRSGEILSAKAKKMNEAISSP
jgi:hypothetical protein